MSHGPQARWLLKCVTLSTLVVLCPACRIPILTMTPGVLGAGFTLPESEWGRADECLVIACYRMRANWYGVVPGPPVNPSRYRVLEPSDTGRYKTAGTLAWGGFGLGGMVPIVPYTGSQCEPMHVLFSARGTYGFRDPDSHRKRTHWPIEKSPRVTRVRSQLRVTGAPTEEPALSMDCVLGYVLCRILLSHDPEHRYARPKEAISRTDAERIARFVAEHAECFSRTTQLLSRRLADHHEWNAPRRGYGLLSRDYAKCREPRFEQVLCNFPEKEREYFERLREELAAEPAKRYWPGGKSWAWSNEDKGTCDVCGTTASQGTTFRRRADQLRMIPAAAEFQPYWQPAADGMMEIDICRKCLVPAVKRVWEHR